MRQEVAYIYSLAWGKTCLSCVIMELNRTWTIQTFSRILYQSLCWWHHVDHTRWAHASILLKRVENKPYKHLGPTMLGKFFRSPEVGRMLAYPIQSQEKKLHLLLLFTEKVQILVDHFWSRRQHILYLGILLWHIYQVLWKAANSEEGQEQESVLSWVQAVVQTSIWPSRPWVIRCL